MELRARQCILGNDGDEPVGSGLWTMPSFGAIVSLEIDESTGSPPLSSRRCSDMTWRSFWSLLLSMKRRAQDFIMRCMLGLYATSQLNSSVCRDCHDWITSQTALPAVFNSRDTSQFAALHVNATFLAFQKLLLTESPRQLCDVVCEPFPGSLC